MIDDYTVAFSCIDLRRDMCIEDDDVKQTETKTKLDAIFDASPTAVHGVAKVNLLNAPSSLKEKYAALRKSMLDGKVQLVASPKAAQTGGSTRKPSQSPVTKKGALMEKLGVVARTPAPSAPVVHQPPVTVDPLAAANALLSGMDPNTTIAKNIGSYSAQGISSAAQATPMLISVPPPSMPLPASMSHTDFERSFPQRDTSSPYMLTSTPQMSYNVPYTQPSTMQISSKLPHATGRWSYLSIVDPNISQAALQPLTSDLGAFLKPDVNSQAALQAEIQNGLAQTAQALPTSDREAVGGNGIHDLFQMHNIAYIKEQMMSEMKDWYVILGKTPPDGLSTLNLNQLQAAHRHLKETMDGECTREVIDSFITLSGRGLAAVLDGSREVFGFHPNLKGPNRNLAKQWGQMQDKPMWKYAIRQSTKGTTIGNSAGGILIWQAMSEVASVLMENVSSSNTDMVRRNDTLDRVAGEKW